MYLQKKSLTIKHMTSFVAGTSLLWKVYHRNVKSLYLNFNMKAAFRFKNKSKPVRFLCIKIYRNLYILDMFSYCQLDLFLIAFLVYSAAITFYTMYLYLRADLKADEKF